MMGDERHLFFTLTPNDTRLAAFASQGYSISDLGCFPTHIQARSSA
jgi:hypothetical protein